MPQNLLTHGQTLHFLTSSPVPLSPHIRDTLQRFTGWHQWVKCNLEHNMENPWTKDAMSSLSASIPTGDPAAEEWSPWSVCSTTCGEGWQTRTRFCVSSSYSTQCSGPLREQRQCNNSAVCPGGLSVPCVGTEGEGRCTEHWLQVMSPLWYQRRCFLFHLPSLFHRITYS